MEERQPDRLPTSEDYLSYVVQIRQLGLVCSRRWSRWTRLSRPADAKSANQLQAYSFTHILLEIFGLW